MKRMITIRFSSGVHRVMPRWAGNGLAVHKPMIKDATGEVIFKGWCRGVWTLTHIPTGYSAGRFYGNLTAAIRFARKWDAQFAAVVTNELPKALRDAYLHDLAVEGALR